MKQLPTSSNFKNDIDVILIIKISIHFDDIWMIKIELNFEFPYKLLDNILLLDELLLDHF